LSAVNCGLPNTYPAVTHIASLYKYHRIYLQLSYKYPVNRLSLRFTEANVLLQRESKSVVKETKILTGNLTACNQSTLREQNPKD